MRFAVLGAGRDRRLRRGGARPRRRGRDADRPRRAPARRCRSTACRCRSPRGDFTRASGGDRRLRRDRRRRRRLPRRSRRTACRSSRRQLGKLLAPRRRRGLRRRTASPGGTSSRMPAPLGGPVLQSVDPGGAISGAIRPEHDRRLRRLLLDGDRRARRHPAHRGHALHDRRAGRTASERCRQISAAFAAGGLQVPGRDAAARPDLAEADRQRRVQPDHRAHRRDPRRARRPAGDARAAAGGHGGVRGGRRPRSEIGSRSRSSGGSRPGSRSATTTPRCCRTCEAGKPLEMDCMTGAVIELAARLGVEVPHVQAVHACARLLDRLNRAA